MNDDEDALWKWLVALAIGIMIVGAFIAWPIIALWIARSLFK